jgi:ABC-type glycerol-3-phosphate transport system permease component
VRKYLVIDFIAVVISILLALIMSFGAAYDFSHNQLRDGLRSLIVTVTCVINAYVISVNLKNELK